MSDALPFHPTQAHPLTGAPIRALGVVAGKTVWPCMGGADVVPPVDAATAPPVTGGTPPVGDVPPVGETKTSWKPETPEQQAFIDALIGKTKSETTRNVEKTWQQKVDDATKTAGLSDAEAFKYRAEKAEGDLATTKGTFAKTLAGLHAKTAAEKAGVSETALNDVLSLADADITAAITDGEVDAAKVAAAIQAIITRLPGLVAKTDTPPPVPGKSGGDFNEQANDHIYTLAEVNAIGSKRLSESPELMAKIEQQFAKGLIK